MRAFSYAAVIAAAIGAALLAAASDRTLSTGAGARPAGETATAAGRRSAAGREVPAARDSDGTPGGRRTRVPAGVLVRAATRRAHERAGTEGAARPQTRGEADVVSVEIDWHASPTADR